MKILLLLLVSFPVLAMEEMDTNIEDFGRWRLEVKVYRKDFRLQRSMIINKIPAEKICHSMADDAKRTIKIPGEEVGFITYTCTVVPKLHEV